MQPAWVTSILDQCLDTGVPLFFKQWSGVRKKRSGREPGDRTWDELPPLPALPAPSAAERKRRREIVEKRFLLHR
jgi:hypothetical protein